MAFGEAANREAIAPAIAALARQRVDVLIVSNDQLFRASRRTVIDEIARRRVPAVYPLEIYVRDGGLLSYGYDRSRLTRNVAVFVDRLLQGAKPADLPFQQPTHFDLVVNPNAAEALGIVVPQSILARARLAP